MNIKLIGSLAAVLLMLSCGKHEEGKQVRIGIAWRGDSTSVSYTSTLKSVREAGAIPVPLPLVKSPVLEYSGDELLGQYKDSHGILLQEYADQIKAQPLQGHELLGEYKDSHGILRQEYANQIKAQPLQGQDLKQILKGLDALIFTGGSDISPTLYRVPEPWHGIESEGMYDGRRDVSDYILMSWCLEREEKLPVLCLCRGMQMLSVVSGATMIQDLKTFFADRGVVYQDTHRVEATAEHGKNFAPHSVQVTDASSLLRKITGASVIDKVPSWHHQAVRSVEGTALKVTAVTPTSGVEIIEAVERTDKPFFIGVQYHPEVAVAKHANKEADANDFMPYDQALVYFRALVK